MNREFAFPRPAGDDEIAYCVNVRRWANGTRLRWVDELFEWLDMTLFADPFDALKLDELAYEITLAVERGHVDELVDRVEAAIDTLAAYSGWSASADPLIANLAVPEQPEEWQDLAARFERLADVLGAELSDAEKAARDAAIRRSVELALDVAAERGRDILIRAASDLLDDDECDGLTTAEIAALVQSRLDRTDFGHLTTDGYRDGVDITTDAAHLWVAIRNLTGDWQGITVDLLTGEVVGWSDPAYKCAAVVDFDAGTWEEL